MGWSWNNIDWSATAGWAQAFVTGIAVFFAARLGEGSAFRAFAQQRRSQLSALFGIYEEAEFIHDGLIRQHRPEDGPIFESTDLDRIRDLLGAMRAVPVLELPNAIIVGEYFYIKRCLYFATRVAEKSHHRVTQRDLDTLEENRRIIKACKAGMSEFHHRATARRSKTWWGRLALRIFPHWWGRV